MSRQPTLPDLLGPDLRLLFVGINPALTAIAAQAPFSSPSNRFFPALFAAGITDRRIDTSSGFAAADQQYLVDRGVGITTLVRTATARAAELTRSELTAGAEQLAVTAARTRPSVIAVLGITGYRIAFERPKAVPGRQALVIGGAQVWVVPNPSGLNRGSSLTQLAAAYREAAVAAGLDVASPPGPP